ISNEEGTVTNGINLVNGATNNSFFGANVLGATNGIVAASGATGNTFAGGLVSGATTALTDSNTDGGSNSYINVGGVSGLLSCTITDQSGASLSITTNDCHFIRIGKLVQWTFNITYPSTANGSTAKISVPVGPNTTLGGTNQTCYLQFPATSVSL